MTNTTENQTEARSSSFWLLQRFQLTDLVSVVSGLINGQNREVGASAQAIHLIEGRKQTEGWGWDKIHAPLSSYSVLPGSTTLSFQNLPKYRYKPRPHDLNFLVNRVHLLSN